MQPPLLYSELAAWWPLLSPREEYEAEADCYRRLIIESAKRPVREVLELGSGGGNNASYLKRSFDMTLVDIAPGMLEVSRKLNPECRHMEGDMRTVRLEREFDAVFIHDAIMYLTTEADLLQALTTAYGHCRSGGVLLITPDRVRETFEPTTDHGGVDSPDGRGLRYLEWIWDPDPTDTQYTVDYAILTRDPAGLIRVLADRHQLGIFPRETWLALMTKAGFQSRAVIDDWEHDVFVGVKPR